MYHYLKGKRVITDRMGPPKKPNWSSMRGATGDGHGPQSMFLFTVKKVIKLGNLGKLKEMS